MDYLISPQQPIQLFLIISLPKTKKEKSYIFATILPTFQTKFVKLKTNPNVGSIQKHICFPFLSPTPQPLEVTRRPPPFQSTSQQKLHQLHLTWQLHHLTFNQCPEHPFQPTHPKKQKQHKNIKAINTTTSPSPFFLVSIVVVVYTPNQNQQKMVFT